MALVQFVTTAAESTQLQNRGADRGPQPGSPAGVVVATGSKSRPLDRKMTGFHIAWVRSYQTRSLLYIERALLGSDVVEWKSNSVPLVHETASVPGFW